MLNLDYEPKRVSPRDRRTSPRSLLTIGAFLISLLFAVRTSHTVVITPNVILYLCYLLLISTVLVVSSLIWNCRHKEALPIVIDLISCALIGLGAVELIAL